MSSCRAPDHNPPDYREPGTYEHTCKACGRTLMTTVEPPRQVRVDIFERITAMTDARMSSEEIVKTILGPRTSH